MKALKHNKSSMKKALHELEYRYRHNYSSKEIIEIEKTILEYCIENNDYTPSLKIYEDWQTKNTVRNQIVIAVLEYCNKNNDYSLALKIYSSTRTKNTVRNQIVIAVLEYCNKNKDYSLALKIYNLSITTNTTRNPIIESLIKDSVKNNNYELVSSFLRSKNKLSSLSRRKIFKAILESNNDESIFTLYKYLFKQQPSYTGYANEELSSRQAYLWASSKYKYYNFQNRLLNKIKKPNLIDIALLLSFEAQSILHDYKKIDFMSNPETEEAIKNLNLKVGKDNYLTNYTKFLRYIDKLLKSKKTILALYLLTNYCAWTTNGDAKLLADAYIEAFVSLNRYDILTKYYDSLSIMNDNIEFLEHITEYFISQKNEEEAQKSIKKMESLEPGYAYISEAKKQVDNISLINKMLSMDIDIEKIDELSGKEFENLLIGHFKKLGFKTKDTPVTGDYGADIIVDTGDDTRFIIQCKRFKSKVNLKAVQEVVGALAHFNGDIGIVITNSSFLNSAIKLAESNDIELWSQNELMQFLSGDVSFSQISTT